MKNKPTCETYPDGTKVWWLNGKYHREDGPAYEGADGTKGWYLNGQYHREDGPAYEGADGTKEWLLNGEIYTKEAYYKKLYELGKMTLEEYTLEMI